LKEKIFTEIFFGPVCQFFPLWQAFRNLFPELGEEVVKTKKGDRSRLAIMLQGLEASVMVRRVVPRLSFALPIVPMLTVHDSLLISEQYAEIAETEIRSQFGAAIGLPPRTHVTPSKVHKNNPATQKKGALPAARV
jgi:hypothetical protein